EARYNNVLVKPVWNHRVTPKLSFILWLALLGKLRTKDSLMGEITDKTCYLCLEMQET
ncbi:hypothetical protein Dimus_018389, partial [Dionaea muscipula]